MSVTLQFHPDRTVASGRLAIESMADSGRYLSQYATGISSGGLTAHPGGDRWRWESRLFGGRYDSVSPDERPVYGAWRDDDPYGEAPRFGSCYVRLRDVAAERATYCWPDSVFSPDRVVGPDELPALLARAASSPPDDPLDDYVEAHVHGGVAFDTDVAAVVLDPCFRSGPVEHAARRLHCAIEWHDGFSVPTGDLPESYRGPEALRAATSLGDVLTPDLISAAAGRGDHDHPTLKRVWHLLARFGRG